MPFVHQKQPVKLAINKWRVYSDFNCYTKQCVLRTCEHLENQIEYKYTEVWYLLFEGIPHVAKSGKAHFQQYEIPIFHEISTNCLANQ